MDAPGQLPDDHLILDEVTQQLATTFQLLSGDPDEAAERALAEIGVDTRTEASPAGRDRRRRPARAPRSVRAEPPPGDAGAGGARPRRLEASGAAPAGPALGSRRRGRAVRGAHDRARPRLQRRARAVSPVRTPGEPVADGQRRAPHAGAGADPGRPPGARLQGRKPAAADRADRRRCGAGAGVDRAPVRRGQGPGAGAGGAAGRDPGDRVRRCWRGCCCRAPVSPTAASR